MSSISILGLGWLGLPLALTLKQSGYEILGSCRTDDKKRQLDNQGISAWIYHLGQTAPPALSTADWVVLNIPPGRKNLDPTRFFAHMRQLSDDILDGPCQHLLFISTTSVYGDLEGVVTEDTQPRPNTESGKVHWQLEQHLLNTGRASILRLAGLVGPRRHPLKYLAGRQLDHGQQAVNLIHLDDVIRAIIAMMHPRHVGQVYHLAATEHPARNDFYTWAAQHAGLPEPLFGNHDGQTGKVVDPSKTLDALGLALKYPSPYQMPIELE